MLLPSLDFFSTDRNIDGSEYTSELVLLLHFPPTLIIMQIFFLSVKKRDTEKRRAKRKIILSDTYMQITYSAAPFFAPFLCAFLLSFEAVVRVFIEKKPIHFLDRWRFLP